MGNLHSKSVFGELAPVLDQLFQKYTEADCLAEARRYNDKDRNKRAERLAVAYDRAKAQALKANMRRVEVMPVREEA